MQNLFRSLVDLGVPAGMSPEQAKYIQMSNFGSLLLMAVNIPYLALCAAYGWILLVIELAAVTLLLPATILLNRRGNHLAATVYFGTLLNLHLVFVTVAVGRETLLPLLIFFTAGGTVTLSPRGSWRLILGALAGIAATYVAAMYLEGLVGPLYLLSRQQAARLQLLVVGTIFALVVLNALIGRFGAISAEDRLRRIFQNVSHELRTPLTLILGPLEGMLSDPDARLPDREREQLEMMGRNARRLLNLINQLLELSRIDSGARGLRRSPGNLQAVVQAIVASFEPLAQQQGMSLTLEAAMQRQWRSFDREIVEKVLSNLLSNAVKFTGPGGAVTVRLEECADAVTLRVTDSGIGIPAGDLERVFDRFYQVDDSTTRTREGTGIGLSLAKELVSVHGGKISASSVPGRGSQFVVTLPLSAAPPPAPLPETSAPRASILVVEDNADMRAYIRSGLEPAYEIVEASDGEEGLRKARENLPHLVLCDVMMPRMDGISFCRAMRADQRLALVPVVMLTARASEETMLDGLAAGAIAYVTKPFSLEVLRARVRGLMEREEAVERSALRDSLTGLLSRAAWEQEAGRELARLRRHGGTASVAFLDLDGFKGINDSQGHRAGDQVLVELAAVVTSGLRSTDIVGRYGGDELVLLLPGSPGAAAARSVERILAEFRSRPIGTPVLHCTLSCGVSELSGDPRESLADCTARADDAMYAAKRKGGNRVELTG